MSPDDDDPRVPALRRWQLVRERLHHGADGRTDWSGLPAFREATDALAVALCDHGWPWDVGGTRYSPHVEPSGAWRVDARPAPEAEPLEVD